MSKQAEEPKEEGPRAFGVVFQSIADGEAHTEASAALHKLLLRLQEEAVNTNGSATGSLKVELVIKVDARGVATISHSTTVKEPKAKRSAATMWITKGGNLTPENPRQTSLPLREVAPQQTRSLDPATPTAKDVTNA